MNRKSITASAAVLLFLCAGPDEGYAQNGIVEMEFEYNETDYIECLGEEVEFNVTVIARGHQIVLPNGNQHFVENWFIEGTASGLTSGLNWYGHAAGPYAGNSNGSQWTEGWIVAGIYEPLDGGRKFKKSQRLRFVSDANGVMRVEHYEPYQFRCLGK